MSTTRSRVSRLLRALLLATATAALPAAPVAAQNLALGRPTAQSSFSDSWKAVDGNTDGDYGHGSVFHTGLETHTWWLVDLGAPVGVGTVRIWNRTECCAERLFPFQVALQDVFDAALNTGTVLGGITPPGGNTQANPIELDFHGASGRFVKVQLEGTNWLHLAEVEVFAAPAAVAAPEPATVALLAGGLALLGAAARRRARAA